MSAPSEPPNHDDNRKAPGSPDLAARLAALKAPGTPPFPEHLAGGGVDPPEPLSLNPTDDDLTARFTQLTGRTPGAGLPAPGPTPANPEDAKTTAELVADVEGERGNWEVNQDDEDEINRLLEEAVDLGAGDQAPEWLQGSLEQDAQDEVEDEDTVLRRIRDEMALEAVEGGKDAEKEEGEKGVEPDTDEDEGVGHEGDDTEEIKALMERFSALGGGLELPAVPTGEVGAGKTVEGSEDGSEEGVQEVDTWCCICNEDAEYVCDGCEGDIYCAECLFEAHTGPDASFEGKRHKWSKYIRPKKIIMAS